MVFSTKRREQTITQEIESRLYPFIGGILKDLRCATLAINGMPDHVHVLVRYPPDLSHSDMLKNVKGRSSRWLGDTFPQSSWRGWQEGFGGFTVSRSLVSRVEEYIHKQKEHHLRQSYEQEVMDFHRLHDMEFVAEDVFD